MACRWPRRPLRAMRIRGYRRQRRTATRWRRAMRRAKSAPNEAYFARADRMLQLAAKYGFLVILDPAETGSWLSVLQSNGPIKSRAYGQYLGARYKDFPNIVWMSGNDFQDWRVPSYSAL